MWNEKTIKIIPAVLFLFCLLEIFELGLIINNIRKTENLEYQLQQNLEVLRAIINLSNKHLECMRLEHHNKKR